MTRISHEFRMMTRISYDVNNNNYSKIPLKYFKGPTGGIIVRT